MPFCLLNEMNTVLEDNDLGLIYVKVNSKAKRIIVRYRNGSYYLTSPPGISIYTLETTIREMKPRLINLRDRKPRQVFNLQTVIKTFTFDVHISESNCSKNYVSLKNGILTLSFPSGTDYEQEHIQDIIRHSINGALRYDAKRILPSKVEALSKQFGFHFSGVKINQSRSRWGSCSTSKSINLSYFCLLLPERLIDLIILHELCHTIEMNHGKNFWKLLDKVTYGKAKELTAELKKFNSHDF